MVYIYRVLELLKEYSEYTKCSLFPVKCLIVSIRSELETLSAELREKTIEFIVSLEVPKLQLNLYKIIYPNSIEVDELELEALTINQLSDSQIIKLFTNILMTINFVEKDEMLLLKYNDLICKTGFHLLACKCRGKIINKNDMSIISYPFDKFFNLDEVESTSLEIVRNAISTCDNITVTNKLDGSLIAISSYNNELIVSTNGAIEGFHCKLAREIISEKYSYFAENIPNGYTFIFEIIHKDDKHVIDYESLTDLFLIGIRDLTTFKLLSYSELTNIADQFKLSLVSQFEFTSLDEMLQIAKTDCSSKREGWVIRISNKEKELIVKLKLEEFFILHRAKAKISINKVYTMLTSNTIDEFMLDCNDDLKHEINELIEEISIIRNKIKKEVLKLIDSVCFELNASSEQIRDNKILAKRAFESLNGKPYMDVALKVIRFPEKLDSSINNINLKTFMDCNL